MSKVVKLPKNLKGMTDEEILNDEELNMGVVLDRLSRYLLDPYTAKQAKEYASILDTLADAVTIQDWLDDELPNLVAVCREQGASWQDVGDRLGISKQAAWERFA